MHAGQLRGRIERHDHLGIFRAAAWTRCRARCMARYRASSLLARSSGENARPRCSLPGIRPHRLRARHPHASNWSGDRHGGNRSPATTTGSPPYGPPCIGTARPPLRCLRRARQRQRNRLRAACGSDDQVRAVAAELHAHLALDIGVDARTAPWPAPRIRPAPRRPVRGGACGTGRARSTKFQNIIHRPAESPPAPAAARAAKAAPRPPPMPARPRPPPRPQHGRRFERGLKYRPSHPHGQHQTQPRTDQPAAGPFSATSAENSAATSPLLAAGRLHDGDLAAPLQHGRGHDAPDGESGRGQRRQA